MSTTGTSTLAVSYCEFLFDVQRHSDSICADLCFSELLPRMLNLNSVMAENGVSVSPDKQPGMF